jgi:hypothetical protein
MASRKIKGSVDSIISNISIFGVRRREGKVDYQFRRVQIPRHQMILCPISQRSSFKELNPIVEVSHLTLAKSYDVKNLVILRLDEQRRQMALRCNEGMMILGQHGDGSPADQEKEEWREGVRLLAGPQSQNHVED